MLGERGFEFETTLHQLSSGKSCYKNISDKLLVVTLTAIIG
jgi:hypothetical protein